MKALVIRVHKGELKVKGETVSSTGPGIAVFVGIEKDDDRGRITKMVEKIVNLRIFENEAGKMNFSVKDKKYAIMCVPNFTLCADTESGRRPSFDNALASAAAKDMYDEFLECLRSEGVEVGGGVFGAHMDIALDLNGPVNIAMSV